ncbi:MAG: type I-E CRISPR-associated protein Cas7/Cse4/CasC [bacterium]|nr:type I-E CRISPR-associated protein Cas7/Cse4/CasC [bacterium]
MEDDRELASKTLRALTEAIATVAPTGHQNSFASRAYASYILAEKGRRQPRSLSVAFLKSVDEKDILQGAIEALEGTRNKMNTVYGHISEHSYTVNAVIEKGSLKDLLDFVSKKEE